MKREVIDFVKLACIKYGMESYYMPDSQVYVLTYKGKAVQNFNLKQFYGYPKKVRMREYRALIHAGINHNLGESYKNQLIMQRKLGIKIYPK